MKKATGSSRQRGAVLIIVLWVLALLMLLLAAFSTSVKVDRQVASEIVQRVRAKAGADAALAYLAAMHKLGGELWQGLAGQVLELPLTDERVRFRLIPEEAYLSLISAPPPLLEALIAGLATEQTDIQLALASLLERRQPGVRATGEEPAGIQEPLHSVEELLLLPGFDRGLVERLAPLVTVDTRQPGVAIAYSPERLILLLSGGNTRMVDALRNAGGQDPQAIGLEPGILSQAGGRVFRLQVEVGRDAPTRKLELTVVFGEGNDDFQIVRRNEYNPGF